MGSLSRWLQISHTNHITGSDTFTALFIFTAQCAGQFLSHLPDKVLSFLSTSKEIFFSQTICNHTIKIYTHFAILQYLIENVSSKPSMFLPPFPTSPSHHSENVLFMVPQHLAPARPAVLPQGLALGSERMKE